MIPTELKFISIDESIAIFVKHFKNAFDSLIRNDVNVALVITEQGSAYQHEFRQRQKVITAISK